MMMRRMVVMPQPQMQAPPTPQRVMVCPRPVMHCPCPPRHEVLVQPGDLLFVPPWWAHEITNAPGWNVAFATKNFAHRENLRVQPARSLMMYSFLAFTHGPSWLLGAKLSGGSEAVNHGETAAVLRRLLLVLVCMTVVVNAAMLRRRTRRHTAAKVN